jgi:hypothetical protein
LTRCAVPVGMNLLCKLANNGSLSCRVWEVSVGIVGQVGGQPMYLLDPFASRLTNSIIVVIASDENETV